MFGRTAWSTALVALLLYSFAVASTAAQETPEQEAARLQQEAQKLLDSGNYSHGIDVAKGALTLGEKILGTEHQDVAVTLTILGKLYRRSGNYELTESTHLRALALREKALGPEHPETAKSLISLGDLYFATNNLPKSEAVLQRALTILTKAGAEHIDTSKVLSLLGLVYTEKAEYDRAETLLKRALAIRERISDAESIDTAVLLNNLANTYRLMGAYARAKTLLQRTLAIREKAQGSAHPEIIYPLLNLATLYEAVGDYVEAEATIKRAMAIRDKTLSAEHPIAARLFSGLAGIYRRTGAYSQADSLFRRAISLQKKAGAAGEADLAESLNNLANMYLDMGTPERAEALFQQALPLSKQAFGAAHPFTAAIVSNLGEVYRQMGIYDKAEPLLKRAIAIAKAKEDSEHRNTAESVYSLASLYSDGGTYLKAMPLYLRAIAIYEKALGPDHPSITRPLRSQAAAHWAMGELRQALSLLQRAQRIQARNSERFLSAGSEARKQDYLQTLTDGAFHDVSFAMSMPGNAATVLGLTSVLRHKGRVLDAVSDNVTRIRRSVAPADQALLEQLADVAGQLSALTYGQGGNLSPDQYRVRLAQLSARQEQLQADLANRSRAFSREVLPVTVANVRGAIPANAVLVEWFRYTQFDPKRSLEARRGPPRYMAYVLKRDAEPIAIDIGQAQPIEALARRLRTALADSATTDVKQHAAALSDKLLAPLRVHLRGVEHILFSPDGELNLVPMAALLHESGAYLTEHFDVSYLTSGRDLLRIAGESPRLANTVVMADPDYGERSAAALQEPFTLRPRRSLDLDRGAFVFRSLPGTALEAQDLKSLLKLDDGNLLLRADASETRLKRLKGPRILHIASHGFFLSDQQLTNEVSKRRGPRAAPLTPSENPLLRSGIALAGANQRSSGEDDGILTALEATQLDLNGTQLVVLSACDSGIGEIQNGEGVYGLRRAVALAGAQTQVTSLWKVADDVTRSLMVDYYRGLQQGEGRAAALRRTQRAMLANPSFSHPYYWASFIAIGNWDPLPLAK